MVPRLPSRSRVILTFLGNAWRQRRDGLQPRARCCCRGWFPVCRIAFFDPTYFLQATTVSLYGKAEKPVSFLWNGESSF